MFTFLCAFELSHDSLWWSWVRSPLSKKQSENLPQTWLRVPQKIPVKFGLQRFGCRCESCVGGREGRASRALVLLDTCLSLHTQCFFNLLTSICTYKQCLQRNTFTGVDWPFHNYPYLKWHGTLTVISHIKNASDPSYYKVHWPGVCWVSL